MTENLTIRQSTARDRGAIEAIYPQAFPDEELLPLVRDLLGAPEVATSLIGEVDGSVVGHVVFTQCGVGEEPSGASLLGPLAVAPSHFGQGIGSALVRAGLDVSLNAGIARVLVLGDPAYYGRFGFAADTVIEAPYPLPAEWASAWQSRALINASSVLAGTLRVPSPWRDPALWSE